MTATGADGSSVTAAASVQTFQPVDTQLSSTFYQYRADLTGLRAGSPYSYRVTVDGQDLAADPALFRFRTPGQGGFSFLAFGDSGAASPEQQSLVQMMAAEPDISMAVHVGDMAYPNGSFGDFETGHFEPNAPLLRRLPLFSTPGNHEYNTDSAAPYLSAMVASDSGVSTADQGRYYSFDWSNAHFVSLDSNLLLTSSASRMLAWLDADLAATDKHWRIVFLHHPPYPTGFHVGDPVCVAVRQLVVPIVERHGVQLVVSGHEHGYERSYPLTGNALSDNPAQSTLYVITGGGGGTLERVGSMTQCALSVEAFNYLRVDVERDQLRLRAIGLDGLDIDSVTLGRVSRIAITSVLSAGDYTRAVAPGSLICITGENLADRTLAGPGQGSPGGLDGVVVTANGVAAPVLSVSPTEINAQLPYDISGPVTIQISTPGGSASASVTVLPAAPSLLEVRSGNRPIHFCSPVRPGAAARLYLTGLGALERPSGIGRVEVWLGKTPLNPLFAGMEPGRPGVYRIDIVIPANLPDGLYALQVIAGGVSSRPANVDIAATATHARNDRACIRVEVHPSRR